ncbi:MAG: hypothetical protein DHS20C20_06670 [Ardenticatenaceae bacterium]|nr:MAG: hypothetical protein DHS20C20_06670 [Ardenticatenaceae bacterium]
MKLIIRLLINAAALWAAAQIVGGISLEGSFGTILVVALIFGVVNAIVRPILTLFSIPFIVVTLGLFIFVINALMLMLTGAISNALSVDGFGAALLGSLVITIVSWLLGVFLKDDEKKNSN